jgi:hypothetical protein
MIKKLKQLDAYIDNLPPFRGKTNWQLFVMGCWFWVLVFAVSIIAIAVIRSP